MTNPELRIITDDSVSIDDLVARQAEGFSVLRSAHVGNLRPYNLALADAGLPILCVDHNITGLDRNYFPESINSQQREQVVAPVGQLVCRTQTEDGEWLDELHLARIRVVTGNDQVFSNTQYLRENEKIAGEVVARAVVDKPDWFQRMALPDGTTDTVDDAAERAGRDGILQLSDDPRAERTAVLMPNEVDIMANFIIEALTSTHPEVQYHLSGPDMVNYIGKIIPELSQWYGQLRGSLPFGSDLPKVLTVRLVPTAEARFATTAERRKPLDDLLAAVAAEDSELPILKAERKLIATSQSTSPEQKKVLLDKNRVATAALNNRIGEAATDIPELWVPDRQTGYITQYDAAAEGGMYVPAINRQATMAELKVMRRRIDSIRRRQKP